jgi:protoporphyrinogen oxidase
MGPHRFFTKNAEVNELWHGMLGGDFVPVNRLTRIYYKNKYFNYPIKALDALSKMGPVEAANALFSYAGTRFGHKEEPHTFEDWITQKFGRKLFETFFKTYTEKVWGIPCSEIGAEWAAQRIKGLDILQVLKNTLPGGKGSQAKTLVEQFDFPRLGSGQMYEAMAEEATAGGARLMLHTSVGRIHLEQDEVKSVTANTSTGDTLQIEAEHFMSSIPLTHFFKFVEPGEPEDIIRAVDALYFRDHISVQLLVKGEDLFPDQWIYIHSPDVKIARLANYNNFSKSMLGSRRDMSGLSAEYFVFQGDEVASLSDAELVDLALEELAFMGLITRDLVEKGWVTRKTECYPTYYIGFQDHYDTLRRRLDRFANHTQIGRGGLYKYNNMDHSVVSGLLAARNYLKLPGSPYNLWDINIDAEYHESAEREERGRS